MLQDKSSKKDDLIKNVMIQNSQLKEENSVLKKNLDEMNNILKTVMNDMHLRFQWCRSEIKLRLVKWEVFRKDYPGTRSSKCGHI